MQKLSTMMIVLLAGASLAGCYSKSCDTACPRGEKMEVALVTPNTPKTVKQKAAPATKGTPAQAVPAVNDTAPAPASD